MSDNVATQLSPEIQHHMAMAFNEPLPQVAVDNNPPAAQQQPPAPAASQPAPEPPAQSQSTNQPAPAVEEGVTLIDPDAYLKEHLGFDNWEIAKAELTNLRQKATTPAEIKFANDQQKRWYEYLSTPEKEDDLYQALHARQQVKSLDTLNDEQRMKLFIRMNNPLFDQELVDYQYQKDYGFDESAYKDENGVVTDPIAFRHAKVASLQRMQNDLSKANDYFSNYKSKIELPEITKQAQQQVDEGYEGYKARTANANEAYEKQIAPALQSLLESDLNMTVAVDDPQNQIKFDLGIAVDKPDFESAKEKSLYFSDWVEETFYDEKGNFLPKKLARAILLEKNFDKYAQSIARQSVNAERKRMIEKETPNFGRREINLNPEVKSELERQMDMALSV